jgi:putative PIN family toxin of toxin-antitoxin system
MTGRPRYVFDTNVIVSAALFEQSLPGQALYSALSRGEPLISRESFVELAEVLSRKKFDRYLTHEEREEFLVKLACEATVVEISEEIQACRDPKDDKFLEVAVCGVASCLITGDGDLLALHPFHNIPILSPMQFLELLTREDLG